VKTEFEKVTALLHVIDDPKYNLLVAFILGSPQLQHDFHASTSGETTDDGCVTNEVWDKMLDKEGKVLLSKWQAAHNKSWSGSWGGNSSGQNGVKLTKGQKKKVAQFHKLEEVATSLMEMLDVIGQEVGKGSHTNSTKHSGTGSPSELFGRKVKEARHLLQSVAGLHFNDDDDEWLSELSSQGMTLSQFTIQRDCFPQFSVCAMKTGKLTDQSELDSHAGTFFVVLSHTSEYATVHLFLDKRQPFSKIPVGTAATAMVNGKRETFILI
jgi:hypothetical protein